MSAFLRIPLGVADPHDTLAAEEFIIGTRDDRWPRDPSGYYEPHDVLAAEAFPMPVPDPGGARAADSPRGLIRLTVALVVLGAAAVLIRRARSYCARCVLQSVGAARRRRYG